jgi:hypothetical protein
MPSASVIDLVIGGGGAVAMAACGRSDGRAMVRR